MNIETAKSLLDKIKAFNVASDGDSNDAEHDAANELADQVKAMLLEESARNIALAELIDEYDQEEDGYEFIDGHFISEVGYQLGVDGEEEWQKRHSYYEICQAVLSVADRLDPKRKEALELQERISQWPADWNKDSSLKTWFPLTNNELESCKEQNRILHEQNLELVDEVRRLKEAKDAQTVVAIVPDNEIDFNSAFSITLEDSLSRLRFEESIDVYYFRHFDISLIEKFCQSKFLSKRFTVLQKNGIYGPYYRITRAL